MKWTEATVAEARQMAEEGRPAKWVASHFGVSVLAMRKVATAHNIRFTKSSAAERMQKFGEPRDDDAPRYTREIQEVVRARLRQEIEAAHAEIQSGVYPPFKCRPEDFPK